MAQVRQVTTTVIAARPGDHLVQFYSGDGELAGTVSGYLANGIRTGGGVLMVATAPHRRAFEAALAGAGIDVRAEQDAGTLQLVDAAELLGGFLSGDQLDHERFQSLAVGLLQRTADGGRPIRIYAEMVALLWDAGQVTLAIELEELWNQLGTRFPFCLLCAYPARVVADGGTAAVREVRRCHSAVIAAEPGGSSSTPSFTRETRSFPWELDSARAARHYVTGLLDRADAAIVAAELAANAVLHARSAFTVTVSRSAARVRIAVRDYAPLESGSFQVRKDHGLGVVSQLASRWAVDRLQDGKVVWVELPACPA
jgi:MEDS: MEthanogen/methylotroph, DcmR Sensory domain